MKNISVLLCFSLFCCHVFAQNDVKDNYPPCFAKPSAAGPINGHANGVCNAINLNYSTTSVKGATSYTWTVPAGVTINSGQGTTSISVTFTSSYTTGTLGVVPTNSCGSGSASSMTVVFKPGTPVAIYGPVSPCNVTTQNYSIPLQFGANNYNWTVPSGASIIVGQGTNLVTVSFTSIFTGGSMCVTPTNSCGQGGTTCMTVTGVSTPAIPGAITGPAALCTVPVTQTYSIAAVSGATTYTWTAPPNGSLTSGQGTNAVTVAFSSNFSSGTISVTAGNSCGSSFTRTLVIIKGAPATPGTISGSTSVCLNSSGTYSIAAVAGAVSYTWTVTTNMSITSGQGTTSVNVSYNGSFTSGALSVTASNACGTSSAKTLSIVHNTSCRTTSRDFDR